MLTLIEIGGINGVEQDQVTTLAGMSKIWKISNMNNNIVLSYLILSNVSNFTFFYISDTYRGTGPFSEPETAAVRDFINAQKQNQDFQV